MDPADSCRIVHCSGEGFIVSFDAAVYRLSAVKSASYKYGDRFHILISVSDSGRTQVVLKPKGTLRDPELLAGEFCNDVLDQELREVVAAQTEGIRNLLLAHTFSQTSILGTETEAADFNADPLGIAQVDKSASSTDR